MQERNYISEHKKKEFLDFLSNIKLALNNINKQLKQLEVFISDTRNLINEILGQPNNKV